MIWLHLLIFAVGIVLIVKGGDFFVDAASWIAEVSGIPKFLIGATIVSVATTLPELFVSMIAASEGKVDMAVGNAVGSVTANTGLILAVSLIFISAAASRKDFLIKSVLLVAASVTLYLFSIGGALMYAGSAILFVIFAIFIYENIVSAKKNAEKSDRPETDKKTIAINVVKFIAGAAGIVIGSRFLVNSGSEIALFFGVSEGIIAVTLVAVGTSLPELVTAVTAIIKKQSSLSVGNIVGANIIDLCLILPLCSLISGKPLPISHQGLVLDMPVCILVTAVAVVPMLIKEKFMKWQGFVLLAFYTAYIVILCVTMR